MIIVLLLEAIYFKKPRSKGIQCNSSGGNEKKNNENGSEEAQFAEIVEVTDVLYYWGAKGWYGHQYEWESQKRQSRKGALLSKLLISQVSIKKWAEKKRNSIPFQLPGNAN